MLPDNPNAPVYALVKERFGGGTTITEAVYSVNTSLFTRIPNNPNRLYWIMINEGSYDVRISNRPDTGNVTGWLLSLNGGVISMDWEEDGEAVCYDIYLIAVGATSNVRIREVIRL